MEIMNCSESDTGFKKRNKSLRRKGWSIWRSWSWNESDGACGRVIWSGNGAALGTASSEIETCLTEIFMMNEESKLSEIKQKNNTLNNTQP